MRFEIFINPFLDGIPIAQRNIKKFMGKDHRGKPSGVDRQEGLGLRPDMPPERVKQGNKMTDKYTSGEDKLADNVKSRHHNRNTNKQKSTRAGGYKQ
jgi:hypothetical protein